MNVFTRFTLVALLILSHSFAQAQDLAYAKQVVQTLASPEYWGRGYTHDGMKKASNYIAGELKRLGLEPLDGKSYLQAFNYPVNTFPAQVEVSINGKLLVTGVDYIITHDSLGMKAQGSLVVGSDSNHFENKDAHVSVTLASKLTWSVAKKVSDRLEIQLDRARFTETPTRFEVNVANQFVPNFEASNISAIVKGTKDPNRFVVFTAHYDHLGGMGEHTYFPGANDNASGDSMVLGLAKYFAAHPQPYSMVFIFFAGEEAGLLGSRYFVEHPLMDLKKIRFVTNFDMVGTGNEGITVVNATEFVKEFQAMQAINAEGKYLAAVNSRGTAANSDHYWFAKNGVPAFFIYTLGGIKAYHDVFDRSATLPFTAWENLFKFILMFNDGLMNE